MIQLFRPATMDINHKNGKVTNIQPDSKDSVIDVLAEDKSPVKKTRKSKKEKKSTQTLAAKTNEKVDGAEPVYPKPILETTPGSAAAIVHTDAAKAKKQRKREKKLAAMEETAITKKATQTTKSISSSIDVDDESIATEQVCKLFDKSTKC